MPLVGGAPRRGPVVVKPGLEVAVGYLRLDVLLVQPVLGYGHLDSDHVILSTWTSPDRTRIQNHHLNDTAGVAVVGGEVVVVVMVPAGGGGGGERCGVRGGGV